MGVRSKGRALRRSRKVCVLGAAVAALFAWGSVVERNRFTLVHERLAVLESGARPLRVLHLSDFHLLSRQKRKIRWLRSLVRLRPHILVLTGDLFGEAQAAEDILNIVGAFRAAGTQVLFVHGSNDYYEPRLKNPLRYLKVRSAKRAKRLPDIDTVSFTDAMRRMGAIDLNNAAEIVWVRGQETLWFGLNDPHILLDDIAVLDQQLGLYASKRCARFALVHAPYQRVLRELIARGARHIFAGHTHGGQVCLPGERALTSNSDLPVSYAQGTHVWRNESGQQGREHASFTVSAGLGTSRFAPIRLFCAPKAYMVCFEAVDERGEK